MRKRMPIMTERAEELPRRMTSEHAVKKRQRLHALYLVASRQARHGQELAALLGVQPIATVVHKCENFYLYGAGAPTTGDSFLLERPGLKTSTFQLWVEHCAQAFPDSFNLLVLDNGALHQANAWRWPVHGAPVCLPPYSPALNPLERL